jgi:hypothetical protein
VHNTYFTVGRILGFLGIVVCAVAAVVRLSGHFFVGGISAESLLSGGIAGVVIGCFLLLLARAPHAT